MLLSDVSVTRPVFASVISLLLIAFGLVAADRLALREYPDIDPPVISIRTNYPGAAAAVVESRITEVIEERIAGVEGIKSVNSASRDGQSTINIEFTIGRDIDSAANDVRDRVSRILNNLPAEADPPEVQKVDADEDVIMWFNFTSKDMDIPAITDYAERYLVDRYSALTGVARIIVGGGQSYAMRIWVDRRALAARNLTTNDIEAALRAENVELPAGSIESKDRQFTVRVDRAFTNVNDFRRLVLRQSSSGHLVRLGDVARIEKGTEENRILFRGNGIAQVGIGIVKQSTANIIDVARAARAETERINTNLPEGMSIEYSYDSSVFVENAIREVYLTLLIAIALVVFVIYLFLGSARAMLVPAVTVPVSLIATFTVLLAMDFSVNLLTLLALVLAIGLVVDDAIVVLENIVRRMEEYDEPPLLAAFNGTRQVGFAVIATTLVLVAVFVPIAFLQGDIGRLFSEFAITMAAAVVFSSLVALTLSPMLASKVLKKTSQRSRLVTLVDNSFHALRRHYGRLIIASVRRPMFTVVSFLALLAVTVLLFKVLPSEYAPKEDRGSFFVMVNGPEGASYEFMNEYMDEVERRLMPYIESGEFTRLLIRAPRSFGIPETFNTGVAAIVMDDWSRRRDGFVVMNEVRAKLADLPGVVTFPLMRQGFSTRNQKPVQFVIGGGTYEELAKWRDILLGKIAQDNPGLTSVDWDYKETSPQLRVVIDYERAAELGVTVGNIGRTLETMLGSRRVTTYIDGGEEYDVFVEGERDQQRTTSSMENIYVRSERSGQLIPLASLVTIREQADATTLNRYNRIRAITIEANLSDDLSLGQALDYLEQLVADNLPSTVIVDYKGLSYDYKYSGESIIFIFILGLMVTFLVLAAQFESYIHPLVIMLSVPLAIAGGLAGLYFSGNTLNVYSQIGLIMLVGLAAKNGILIVEFANQLRDSGMAFQDALIEAAQTRLRPILMTSFTTVVGAIPLIISSGAGAETRATIGIVVMGGVLAATFFTIFVVPVAYALIAKNTGSPGATKAKLMQQSAQLRKRSTTL